MPGPPDGQGPWYTLPRDDGGEQDGHDDDDQTPDLGPCPSRGRVSGEVGRRTPMEGRRKSAAGPPGPRRRPGDCRGLASSAPGAGLMPLAHRGTVRAAAAQRRAATRRGKALHERADAASGRGPPRPVAPPRPAPFPSVAAEAQRDRGATAPTAGRPPARRPARGGATAQRREGRRQPLRRRLHLHHEGTAHAGLLHVDGGDGRRGPGAAAAAGACGGRRGARAGPLARDDDVDGRKPALDMEVDAALDAKDRAPKLHLLRPRRAAAPAGRLDTKMSPAHEPVGPREQSESRTPRRPPDHDGRGGGPAGQARQRCVSPAAPPTPTPRRRPSGRRSPWPPLGDGKVERGRGWGRKPWEISVSPTLPVVGSGRGDVGHLGRASTPTHPICGGRDPSRLDRPYFDSPGTCLRGTGVTSLVT